MESLIHSKISELRNNPNKELNLRSLELDSIPDSIGFLTELKYLDLSRNRLTALPESFINLKNLEKLDLSNNKFEILPNWLSKLPKLKNLNLSNNLFREIPDCVIKLAEKVYAPLHLLEGVFPNEATVLGILDIFNGQRFVKIPRYERDLDEAAHCYNVNDEGHITAILSWEHDYPGLGIFPEQLCELGYLEELYLNVHHIKTIPQSINMLKRLKILNLAHNSIESIPESLIELKNFRILDLRSNQIKQIPNSIIPFLKNLETFNCDIEVLKKLEPTTFENLLLTEFSAFSLEILKNIVRNLLEQLPYDTRRILSSKKQKINAIIEKNHKEIQEKVLKIINSLK